MGNGVPNIDASDELVNELDDLERQRQERRQKKPKKGAPSSNAPKKATSEPTDVPPEKSNRRKGNASPLELVERRHRQNLTLKGLQENDVKFNQLFLKLQLQGDCRKKQDLADEALELLFSKYRSVLETK